MIDIILDESITTNEVLTPWKDQIIECTKLRVAANELKEQAAQLEEQANTILSAIAQSTGVKEFPSNAGQLAFIPANPEGSTSFKKDILKKFLLSKGVAADIIADGFKEATKKSNKKEQVRWTPRKEEK